MKSIYVRRALVVVLAFVTLCLAHFSLLPGVFKSVNEEKDLVLSSATSPESRKEEKPLLAREIPPKNQAEPGNYLEMETISGLVDDEVIRQELATAADNIPSILRRFD